MWVRAFRGFNHSGQDTTSAAEGFHFSLKLEAKASRRGLAGRTVPWLLQLIYDTLEPKYTFGQMLKCSGAVVNKRSEAAVRRSIEAARDIPAGSVTVLCAQRGTCSVVSCTRAPLEHVVEDALGDDPHCSCAAGSQGGLCKHVVRCMVLLGRSEREIQLLHGSLKGMELPEGTVPKLHRGVVSGGAAAAPSGAAAASEVAAAEPAEQPARQATDRKPEVRAALQQLLDISEREQLPGAEILAAVNAALATLQASIIAKQALPEVLHFSVPATAREGNSLQRQLTIQEQVSKRRGTGSRVRVVADATHAAAAGLPAAFPAANRRDYAKRKSWAEQLGGDEQAGSAVAALQTVHETSILQTALVAARQAPDAMAPHMAALMTDRPVLFQDAVES